jgi:UDP-N-acetylglucosamine kinase
MASERVLTDEELDELFASDGRRFLFGDDATADDDPVLILVGAQPGAGKTRAGQAAVAAAGQPVEPIIGDDLRFFHPDYETLLRKNPAAMPDATAHVSSGLVERAIAYAVDHRKSVLIEGTFRRPHITMQTAQQFADAGFRVEAHLVAVAPEVSRQSITTRYVDDARAGGAARFTSLTAHDESFAALPDTIRAISGPESPVARIVVHARDRVLLDIKRTPGRRIKGAIVAAQHEWDRPRVPSELEEWHTLVDAAVDWVDVNIPTTPEMADLTAQLSLDGEYLDLRADGSTVIRGHVRNGRAVRPHMRRPPRGR